MHGFNFLLVNEKYILSIRVGLISCWACIKFYISTEEAIYGLNETNTNMKKEQIYYQVYEGNWNVSMKWKEHEAINCFVTFWFLEWSLVKNVQKGIFQTVGVACLMYKRGRFFKCLFYILINTSKYGTNVTAFVSNRFIIICLLLFYKHNNKYLFINIFIPLNVSR